MATPLRIGFAPWMVAGVRTQWENMRPHVLARPDIQPHVVELHPYRRGGLIERLPMVPNVVAGNLRTFACATGVFRPARLDALWTHQARAVLPYVLSKGLLQRTVVLCAADSTSMQQAAFGTPGARSTGLDQSNHLAGARSTGFDPLSQMGGAHSTGFDPTNRYYAKTGDGPRAWLRDALDTFCLQRATLITSWSAWAARSFRDDHHIAPERIRVLPPGIDLARWPYTERRVLADDPLRLLFVGGDFARKGGDLLLDVFRRQLQGRCELHLVTKDPVQAAPGVYVYHDLTPNDPRLRELYRRCDLFVLPTYADCFSLASMEAMATGLPVITTAVGGIPEIVAERRSGFLIAPGDGQALVERIRALMASPALRLSMGREGRRIVEERFDAARNTALLLQWIEELVPRRRHPSLQGAERR